MGSGGAESVIFPDSPETFYEEEFLEACERKSVSFQGIPTCLPS